MNSEKPKAIDFQHPACVVRKNIPELVELCVSLEKMNWAQRADCVRQLVHATAKSSWHDGIDCLLSHFPPKDYPVVWSDRFEMVAQTHAPLILAVKQNNIRLVDQVIPYASVALVIDVLIQVVADPLFQKETSADTTKTITRLLGGLPQSEELTLLQQTHLAELFLAFAQKNIHLVPALAEKVNPLIFFESLGLDGGLSLGDEFLWAIGVENMGKFDWILHHATQAHIDENPKFHQELVAMFSAPDVIHLAPHLKARLEKEMIIDQLGLGCLGVTIPARKI